jgi:hypothetical protein
MATCVYHYKLPHSTMKHTGRSPNFRIAELELKEQLMQSDSRQWVKNCKSNVINNKKVMFKK